METFVLQRNDQRFVFNVGDGFSGIIAGLKEGKVWSYLHLHTVPVEDAREDWKSYVKQGFKQISLEEYAG